MLNNIKISVSMIVKNEEQLLSKCLDSIKGLDEIIICDTGSSDKTIEVAKKYTDKVFTDYKWEDSFCKARNHAQSKCTGDWILIIDADETLEEGGVEKIRKAVVQAEEKKQTYINLTIHAIGSSGKDIFKSIRLHKRISKIYWKGDIHNYLSVSGNYSADIVITAGYSPAHLQDPDRALRILTKVMKEDPKKVREAFYLAREYYYRDQYATAIYWYEDYLSRSYWAPEQAEAHLMIAKCYQMLGKYHKAKKSCLNAIEINADFKEALLLMASLCGPNNKAKWIEYSNLADSKNVLFNRCGIEEKKSNYYDKLFSFSKDMSRYFSIYEEIGRATIGKKVLDIGCGIAELRHFVDNYSGFDFSLDAIKIANSPNVWHGDAYDKKNYEGNYDVYVLTEVLEHLDDFAIIKNIPHDKKVIFSVPSFADKSHLRTYTKNLVYLRFGCALDIENITQYNYKDGMFYKSDEPCSNYILLVEATKR